MLKRTLAAEVNYHHWVEFRDINGAGWCEPEAYIVLKDRILLFECKLTGGPLGKRQMLKLYAPLLERIYSRPVVALLICKYTSPECPGPRFAGPIEFLRSGLPFGTWHCLNPQDETNG